ncbi:DUF302 domain-containing protein [Sulfurimonas sp.]|uniref:DUF302 domain-containing protein n=1 Tax=Sulfurimonas sp. TaxID=2022749 RepID=UPI0026341502|nr:DUF302 domain-containing protein [Sulfurimonas sp.]
MKKLVLGLSALAIMMFMSGCSTMHMGWTAVTGQHKLDDGAMKAYDDMFTKVVKDGDPAKAMMVEFKVADDVSGDDVKESITALTEEYNMRLTNYVKMFTKEDAKPNEVKEARIYSLCSLPIAKKFLNHSRYFGGFMPCRIMYVQYGNGDAYLITMDLTLAIHGGYPLSPEMLKLATTVEKSMNEITQRAANGDF